MPLTRHTQALAGWRRWRPRLGALLHGHGVAQDCLAKARLDPVQVDEINLERQVGVLERLPQRRHPVERQRAIAKNGKI